QNEHTNGFLLHHGLLLDEKYVPLGLLHQQVIHRERKEFGKAAQWRTKPTPEKESNKWLEGVKTGIRFSKETGRQLIHVMDREADILQSTSMIYPSKESLRIKQNRNWQRGLQTNT
ncbi:MAG: transposase, partial [Mucilaginibacter sp.]|nr:transposase [Mucilaginibacter sp.]